MGVVLQMLTAFEHTKNYMNLLSIEWATTNFASAPFVPQIAVMLIQMKCKMVLEVKKWTSIMIPTLMEGLLAKMRDMLVTRGTKYDEVEVSRMWPSEFHAVDIIQGFKFINKWLCLAELLKMHSLFSLVVFTMSRQPTMIICVTGSLPAKVQRIRHLLLAIWAKDSGQSLWLKIQHHMLP